MRMTTLLLCLTLALPAHADDVRSVSDAAFGAYQAKDWPTYLENMKKLDALRPNHSRVLYNLACAYALAGEKDSALDTLARVADMGMIYPVEKDEDLASIREDERFAKIVSSFEANGRETGDATVAFEIADVRGSVPEGLARNADGGDAWVGLVRDRAIWHVDREGHATKLELPDNVWSVMGMKFDERTGKLWFCTAATPMMREKDDLAVGSSAVVAWDVAKSKVVGRWDLPADDTPHWLGDLTIAGDGTVYATDSRTPAIYRIPKDSESIERWLTNEGFASLQGLAWSEASKRLYVADYSKGIWSIDVESGDASLLSVPYDGMILGIDGLYLHDGDLIGVQNGTNPHRIIRLHLDPGGAAIESVETLEANRPQFDEPTLGLVEGDWFWFVATSGWGSFTDDGVLKKGAEERPVVVMKRKL